jgi:hypothetical protein
VRPLCFSAAFTALKFENVCVGFVYVFINLSAKFKGKFNENELELKVVND